MSDLRSRAILYARQQELHPDIAGAMEESMSLVSTSESMSVVKDGYIITDMARFRIGIDNMIAAAFEMAYSAAQDDAIPRRALVDKLPWSRRARAARAARKATGADIEPSE